MASDKTFVDLVVSKIKKAGEVSARAMFGEYAIYCDGKLVALICDNQLFVKRTEKGRAFAKNPVEGSPYPGAKPCFVIPENAEPAWLTQLVTLTARELPPPKPKKAKMKAKKKVGEKKKKTGKK